MLRLIPGYDPFGTAGDCTWDEAAGMKPIQFFEQHLHHVKGDLSGKPFQLQPWQQAIVGNLFGWKRPDGSRRYREAFIFVPRKNGKTPAAAGIGNYVLYCDEEQGAECYCAAVDREQANLVFSWSKQMVAMDPDLNRNSKVFIRSIVRDEVGSFFKVLSADAPGKHGQNSHLVIIDELHAQPNRDLIDVLTTSTGARRQPLIIYLTTSDYHRESICNEKYDYACKVRDGVINDPAFLPVIYEAKPDDDWQDPAVWKKANPNFGVSLFPEYVERECRKAKDSPAYENAFKRLQLNMRTQQDVRWLKIEIWDRGEGDVDRDALVGHECVGGLDLASTTDIAAFVLLFREPSGGFIVLPHFWIPEESAVERERRDRVPYVTWANHGLLEMTEGNAIDYDVIRRQIVNLGKLYHIQQIAVDRWNAQQLSNQLQQDGLDLVAYPQNFQSMSPASKELERLLLTGRLNHGGNPILRWMASNVAVRTDAAGNIKPCKQKSTEKIDGIVALIMAIGRMIGEGEFDDKNIYNSRPDLLTI